MNVLRGKGVYWRDYAVIGCLIAGAVWLFRLHILGQVVFIGNSDRLNTMFNLLGFYTDNLRQGRVTAWNETMFGGFNALAQPYTVPTPLTFLESLAGPEHLLYVAGLVACLLLAGSGCAAYAFIRDVCGHPFASGVGAALYMFCALSTLKVSQNDLSFAVLIAIPIMMLLLRRIRRGSLRPCFLGLAVLFTCMLGTMFLQKVAYALLLGGGYTLYLSLSRRDWRPLVVAGAAFLAGLTAAFPRIYTVGEEISLALRGDAMSIPDVASYSAQVSDRHQIPPYVALRWLDDGLFGRFPADARRLGNPLNLSEGMLLYTSSLTVFLLLAGALRFRGRWLRLLLFREPDVSYLFFFLVFCSAVVVFPTLQYLIYCLFLRRDFIHPRIIVAGVLPLATLVAVLLHDFLGECPREISPRRAALIVVGCLALAGALAVGSQRLYRARGGAALDVSLFLPGTRVLAGAAVRIGAALAVFVALCLARAWACNRPTVRWGAGVLLGLLLVLDAAAGANYRINGAQNRPHSNPYAGDNLLLAEPGTFHRPSVAARSAFAQRLEVQDYRCVTVGDPAHFPPVCASHLSQFWGLRQVDGYLSGTPRELHSLPWPKDICGERTISFTPTRPLPWQLLALLNVKYAVLVNEAFYQNRVKAPGGCREVSPDDVRILENPERVVPRYFLAARAEAAPPPDEMAKHLLVDGHVVDLTQTSYVEGLDKPLQFAVGASVQVRGAGDRLDLEVAPADEPRFLVLNERYHPRWRAHAGKQELPVYRTNGVMRGVVIPPGESHVTLRFTPFVLSGGAVPFYLSALALLVAGSWQFRRMDRGRWGPVPTVEGAWLRRAA